MKSVNTRFNTNFSEPTPNRTLISPPPGVDDGRILFTKLQKYPHLRQALSAVNAARAFKYGSRSYGHKKWYREDFDISRGLKSNESRRQFRFGLKSNVEFLIQLDLQNLRSCFLDPTYEQNQNMDLNDLPPLSDGSFIDLMKKMNPSRYSKFCNIMNRLHGNLNFSQSLNEYFATDDMLEPVLMLIAEAMRKGPDLGTFLRGGSVAASTLMYRHRASPNDHDWKTNRYTNYTKNTYNSRKLPPERQKLKNSYKYTVGYCFQFQQTGSCESSECRYFHKCSKCHEPTQGEDTCERN